MKDLNVLPGTRYGKLLVVSEGPRLVQPSGQRQRTFLCECDCGKFKHVRLSHLRHGSVKACGCLGGVPSHGKTRTKLYSSWRAMKMRCNWGGYSERHLYGGRGITIDPLWSDFEVFSGWAMSNGYKHGLQIDRKDPNGNYGPDNCRWVTSAQNGRNRRNTLFVKYDGKKVPLTEVLEKKQLMKKYSVIHSRIARGWSGQEAIDTVIRKGNYRRS